MNSPLTPFAPDYLVSRDGFGSPIPRQPSHLHVCMYVWSHIYCILYSSKSMDQPGKVANPASGQLNREK